MARSVNAALVLEPGLVKTLVDCGSVQDFSRMGFCEGFLAAVREQVREVTGFDAPPSAVLTRYCGREADVNSLGGDIGSVFPTAPVNFVFDLRVPEDAILQIGYFEAVRLNAEFEEGVGSVEELRAAFGNDLAGEEDVVGFVPEINLDWISKFAVLNSDWEVEQRNLGAAKGSELEVQLMNIVDEVIEYRRARHV